LTFSAEVRAGLRTASDWRRTCHLSASVMSTTYSYTHSVITMICSP